MGKDRIGRERPLKEHSKTSRFFQELAEELDLIGTFGYRPITVMKYGMQGVRRMRLARERKWQREAMRRLVARRLIEIKKTSKEYRVALTEKGAQEIFRLRVLDADPLPKEMTCFVIFDIPEAERSLRDLLRRFLLQAGVYPLQKSVWISPFDLAEPLRDLLRIKGAQQWVRIFVAKEV